MSIVSVIIPVYNGEKTIQETIESVLKQTFTDFELIVINDGSQDSTLAIVASFQDSRLKVFSYPNAGLAESRNRGVDQAIGDFIVFLDADDLWTPNKLESQVRALQENPQAAVAYSWTDYIDESSNFLYPGDHITVSGDVYAKLLVRNFLDNGSNPLIRRQALTEVGRFDSSINSAADWDMWLRLAARYHFVAVPVVQVLYRVCRTSMSANIARQEAECLSVISRAFNQAPKSLQHLKKLSLGHLYSYLTFKSLGGEPRREEYLTAARCFWLSVRNDPSILQRRSRLMLVVALKIIAALLLPSKQAQAWLKAIRKRSNSRLPEEATKG
jgi:glycosyltransferase involved in cell wall biosynthesis